MVDRITIGDISVDVVFKNIKNVHLSVHPPTGRVRVSAPKRVGRETLRVYLISKLDWIRRNQKKMQAQERETPREYLERESHYVWGKRYLLQIIEQDQPPSVELDHQRLLLTVRPGTGIDKRRDVIDQWYRDELKRAALPVIAKWEPIMGVRVAKLHVQRMKTKWGGCNHGARSIRLNTELAKKPPELLEYIIVHEMAHLLEPTHNERFTTLMDRFLPSWKHRRDQLNQLPVGYEDWEG